MLNFQEARSLINDGEILKKILKIEEDLKSTLALPEEKEVVDEFTSKMDEKPIPGEKESEKIIMESEIGNGEEIEKTSEAGIIEPTVKIAEPEGETENTAIEVEGSETELQLSETE